MRRGDWWRVLMGGLIGAVCVLSNAAQAEDMSNVLAVVHNAGVYYFGTTDYLNQGAADVAAVGTHVIKIELDKYDLLNTWTNTNNAKYPWNSDWTAVNSSTTLTTIATSTYFKTLFSNPNFTTYIMTTYCPNIPSSGGDGGEYWYANSKTSPFSTSWANAETTQIQNLCENLMAHYSGKTFIIEDWEGDGALQNVSGGTDTATEPVAANAVKNMTQWMNARALGVHNAMAAKGSSTSNCYCSFEVNLVKDAMNEGDTYPYYTCTDDVMPNTSVDYGSYSCYDTEYNSSGADSFANAVQWLADHLPPTAIHGQSPQSVLVGEYGTGEAPGTNERTAATVDSTINNVVKTVMTDGMPYACYWNMLDNGEITAPVNGNNEAVKGYWLIRPDGTPGTAWHQYRARIIGSSPTRANTTEIVNNGLTNYYTSAFPSSGTNLGTGWTTNTNGGDYTIAAQSGNVVMQLVQNAGSTPVGQATLNIGTVAGRGLEPGEYLQFPLKRLSNIGVIGMTLFNVNHGSGNGAGVQPAYVYSDNAWVPFSFNISGSNPSYNWANNNTLGIRLDSADGTFATCSFYLNGAYIGSWVYETTDTTLSSFSLLAQSSTNASFQFGNVSLYLDSDDLPLAVSSTSLDASSTSTVGTPSDRDKKRHDGDR